MKSHGIQKSVMHDSSDVYAKHSDYSDVYAKHRNYFSKIFKNKIPE